MKYNWAEVGPGDCGRAVAQQNGNASKAQSNNLAQQSLKERARSMDAAQGLWINQQYNAPIAVTGRCVVAPLMTAADLGIVDQNLDDKIGMEP